MNKNPEQEDLTSAHRDFALFFPSISSIYVRYISQAKELVKQERIPKGLPFGVDSLNFLDPEKGLYKYKYGLYSAGQATLDLEKSKNNESIIHTRDRKNTVIMGDSGGFQIATNVFKLPWSVDNEGKKFVDWANDKKNTRHRILKWLEATSDIAMILDLPTAAIERKFVDTFDDCLRNTLDNLNYFVKNREPGKVRFLNVLQGLNDEQTKFWWNSVKDFPFEGWAFGGKSATDFYFIIKRLLEMRDGKYFEKHPESFHKRNWLHFLGISRLQACVAFTALQRSLRKHVDPSLTISYDAASAFKAAGGYGLTYTNYKLRKNDWAYFMDKAPDNKLYAGSDLPWPWQTTPGKRLLMGDICVNGPNDLNKHGKIPSTSFDSFSYCLLMWFSVHLQMKGIQEANMIFDLDRRDTTGSRGAWVGRDNYGDGLYEFSDLVEDIFTKENSHTLLDKHRPLFEKITGKLGGQGASTFSDLFNEESNADVAKATNEEDRNQKTFEEAQAEE